MKGHVGRPPNTMAAGSPSLPTRRRRRKRLQIPLHYPPLRIHSWDQPPNPPPPPQTGAGAGGREEEEDNTTEFSVPKHHTGEERPTSHFSTPNKALNTWNFLGHRATLHHQCSPLGGLCTAFSLHRAPQTRALRVVHSRTHQTSETQRTLFKHQHQETRGSKTIGCVCKTEHLPLTGVPAPRQTPGTLPTGNLRAPGGCGIEKASCHWTWSVKYEHKGLG